MNSLILLAAGSGSRFGGTTVKQFVEYRGKPIFVHALNVFLNHPAFSEFIVVGKADLLETYRSFIDDHLSTSLQYKLRKKRLVCVAGGEQRIDSLQRGLDASENTEGLIAIHDGARPFLATETIDLLIDKMCSDQTTDAALPAVALVDTIKHAPKSGRNIVSCTVDRRDYIAAQTPQVIRRQVLDRALIHWHAAKRPAVTDDVQLVELMGGCVRYVEGDVKNKKITVKDDLVGIAHCDSAGSRVVQRYLPRVGVGYDVHRLVDGRPLILGGLTIPHTRGLDGHSDADVLSHAISDALLGACAMGDIGQHFPPSDMRYKGADSIVLLQLLLAKIGENGFDVGNIDAVLACEQPKLAQHIPKIRTRLADALGIDSARVSVKATTTERLGFEGREEGISCYATCMVFEQM